MRDDLPRPEATCDRWVIIEGSRGARLAGELLLPAGAGPTTALTVAAHRREVRALALRSGKVVGTDEVAVQVTASTLLVVGERDTPTLRDNEWLLTRLAGNGCLVTVPDGGHLLEEPGVLELTGELIATWFMQHLAGESAPWLALTADGAPARVHCRKLEQEVQALA